MVTVVNLSHLLGGVFIPTFFTDVGRGLRRRCLIASQAEYADSIPVIGSTSS